MIFSVFQKNWAFGYSWSTRKPRFPMDKRPLVEGRIANFGIFLDVFEFLHFGWFFPFFKKIGFWGILGPLSYGIGATIRIGREMLCLPYAGFFFTKTLHSSFWQCSLKFHDKFYVIRTQPPLWYAHPTDNKWFSLYYLHLHVIRRFIDHAIREISSYNERATIGYDY